LFINDNKIFEEKHGKPIVQNPKKLSVYAKGLSGGKEINKDLTAFLEKSLSDNFISNKIKNGSMYLMAWKAENAFINLFAISDPKKKSTAYCILYTDKEIDKISNQKVLDILKPDNKSGRTEN